MATTDILGKIRLALRISHHALDEDIMADINACLADLTVCGIADPDETDPLIYNAVKLYCKSTYTDDPANGAEYLRRYNDLKACLMMAEGYGRPKEASSDG